MWIILHLFCLPKNPPNAGKFYSSELVNLSPFHAVQNEYECKSFLGLKSWKPTHGNACTNLHPSVQYRISLNRKWNGGICTLWFSSGRSSAKEWRPYVKLKFCSVKNLTWTLHWKFKVESFNMVSHLTLEFGWYLKKLHRSDNSNTKKDIARKATCL